MFSAFATILSQRAASQAEATTFLHQELQRAMHAQLQAQRERLAQTRFKVGPWRFYGNGRSAKA